MQKADAYRPDPSAPPIVLTLPFRGRWLARNTPARRVPSHGTHFLGQGFAVDFAAVDARRRTAAVVDWRSVIAVEPAERFFAFGAPILAPAAGEVVAVHDGEADHAARRSPAVVLPYLLTQGSRLAEGLGAIVGNHVIFALGRAGPYVLLAHLRAGSARVQPGQSVTEGQAIAACGNSGNSTQPHVHLQVMDSPDLLTARGLPLAFRSYRAWDSNGRELGMVEQGVPAHREAVEPLPAVA
jgi:hypothetical protein